jgi:fibronectin type 3 domain-containing protein
MFAQTVPQAYQAIYNNMTTQISAFQTTVNQGWKGTAYPVEWAPHLSSAESDQFTALLGSGYFNQTVLLELQEIRATGAKAVTVHINFPVLYQPFYTYTGNPSQYEQFVSFYQQVASAVHTRGMKLIVESTVSEALDGTQGSAFAPYYQTLGWNDYMTFRAQNAVNVAQLVKPDYLSLICEPDSESTNAYQPTENSPTGAMQLLQTILTALQEAKVTNVMIGAGAGTWISDFTTYLQNFSTTNLNYIDMHVYPVNNNDLMNVLAGASIIQQSGKKIGVSEAWANKLANSELGTLNINTVDSRDVFSFWAPIDTAFLQAMVDCAQYQQFEFFSPSYPEYFAAYLNYTTDGTLTPQELLPDASQAAGAANQTGAFTSTGVAFTKMLVGVDKTPPSVPAVPAVSTVSGTGVTLAWTASTDNVGVAGYNIYRNGLLVAQSANTTYADTGLTPGLTYSYTLSAFDAQGNASEQSSPLSVLTIDTTPPTVPANLAVSGVTPTSVSLKWSPSTSPGGVSGYRVLKGSSVATLAIIANVTGTTYTDSYATPSTSYYYAVESFNPIGVSSAPSAPVTTVTPAIKPPTGLKATSVLSTSITLSWTAATGTGTTGYRILKGTSPTSLQIVKSSVSGTNYTDTGVGPTTTYYYEIETVGSMGYTSVPTPMLTVATPKYAK